MWQIIAKVAAHCQQLKVGLHHRDLNQGPWDLGLAPNQLHCSTTLAIDGGTPQVAFLYLHAVALQLEDCLISWAHKPDTSKLGPSAKHIRIGPISQAHPNGPHSQMRPWPLAQPPPTRANCEGRMLSFCSGQSNLTDPSKRPHAVLLLGSIGSVPGGVLARQLVWGQVGVGSMALPKPSPALTRLTRAK